MRIIRNLQRKGVSMLFLCLLLWPRPARAETSTTAATPTDKSPVAIGAADKAPGAANAAANAELSKAAEHAQRGNLLLKQGTFQQALRSFEAALALNPHLTAAKIGKGVALSRKGELAKAEQVLKDALQHNPDPIRAHYELGLVYQKMGDLDRAASEYKEGIRKHEQGRH